MKCVCIYFKAVKKLLFVKIHDNFLSILIRTCKLTHTHTDTLTYLNVCVVCVCVCVPANICRSNRYVRALKNIFKNHFFT